MAVLPPLLPQPRPKTYTDSGSGRRPSTYMSLCPPRAPLPWPAGRQDDTYYCALTLSMEISASKVALGLLRKSTLAGVAPSGQGEDASETQYLFQPMDESTTPSVERSKLAQSVPCVAFRIISNV